MTGQARRGYILLAEDEDPIRYLLTLLLENEGYPVAAVRNGREAMDYLARNPAPELMLLDLLMPEVDGMRVLDRVRRDPRLHRVPVVMLTGTSHVSDIALAMSVGADYYLSKPINVPELTTLLRRACPREALAAVPA